MKKQYPHLAGFQPTILSQGEVSFARFCNNMVQFLFKGSSKSGHWLTIATLNLKPEFVNIYDSLNLDLDNDVTN